MEVSGFEESGDEGVVGEAALRGHFVEQEVSVAGVERGAARVHEEDGVGGREGGGDVAGLEEELVELPAGGGAAGAEKLDAGVDVDGDGHGSSSSVGKPERTGHEKCRRQTRRSAGCRNLEGAAVFCLRRPESNGTGGGQAP
jgi:hypothetical protein